MSRNGIGIATARGTGTNGYTQRNASLLPPPRQPNGVDDGWINSARHPDTGITKPNADILRHEARRKVELACLEMQEQLEEEGQLTDLEIQSKVQALRNSLANQGAEGGDTAQLKAHQTHLLAQAKEAEMETLRLALGVDANYTSGRAFSPSYAEERKEKIAMERQRNHEAYLARQQARADALAPRIRMKNNQEDGDEVDKEDGAASPLANEPSPHRGRLRSISPARERSHSPAHPNRSPSPRKEVESRGRDDYAQSQPPRRRSSVSLSRSPPPPPRRRLSVSLSRSPPPPPRRRLSSRSPSRSRSPPRRRRAPSRSISRSRSPPAHRRRSSISPPRRRGRSPSWSRSPPRRRAPSRSLSRSPRRRRRGHSASSTSSFDSRRSGSPPRYPPQRGGPR